MNLPRKAQKPQKYALCENLCHGASPLTFPSAVDRWFCAFRALPPFGQWVFYESPWET